MTHNDSEGYMKWLTTLKDQPDIVSYSLRPLYKVMPKKPQKVGMMAAIEQYLKENAVRGSPKDRQCSGYTPNLEFDCCPMNTRRGTLTVTILRAWNLKGDLAGETDR